MHVFVASETLSVQSESAHEYVAADTSVVPSESSHECLPSETPSSAISVSPTAEEHVPVRVLQQPLSSESSFSARTNIHALDKPNQPEKSFKFPQRKFGAQHQRSFQSQRFKDYSWLHDEEQSDRTFCFACVKALQNTALITVPSNADAFVNEKSRPTFKMLQFIQF